MLPIKMVADIIVLMPDDVRNAFDLYVNSDIKDASAKKVKYLELIAAMKKDLKQRDSAINTLFPR